jgi:hypothetical protein
MRAWAFAAAVLVVLAVAGCGSGEETSSAQLPRAVSARTSFTPNIHLFAEPVVARLDVIVGDDSIDPAGIRVKPDFRPYEVVGNVAREQESFGGLTRLRYRFTLRCLLIECIPAVLQSTAGEAESGRGDRVTFRFKPAQVLYDDSGAEPRLLRSAPWPPLEAVSRINASAIPRYGFVFRSTFTPLPEITYHASPTVLGAGLLGGAFALLVLPVGLVARWLRSRRPPSPEPQPELPRLERALLLVEWARAHEDGADRRRALEALAVELDVLARAPLAERARALAWSSASPSPVAGDELVTSVRESDAGSV